jgi:hypothetical protein
MFQTLNRYRIGKELEQEEEEVRERERERESYIQVAAH